MTATEREVWMAMLLCDSGFPGGSFSHSQGLESALYHGYIAKDNGTLQDYLALIFEQVMNQSLPFVSESHARSSNTSSDDLSIAQWLASIRGYDSSYHSMLTNASSRRSSITQGRCFLKVASEIFSDYQLFCNALSSALCRHDGTRQHVQYSNKLTTIQSISNNNNDNDMSYSSSCYDTTAIYRGHYAPLFGAFCGLLNLSLPLTELMFMRGIMRDAISAACRLNIIGPIEGTKLQLFFSKKLEETLQQRRNSVSFNITNAVIDTAIHGCDGGNIEHTDTLVIEDEMLQYLKPKNKLYLQQQQISDIKSTDKTTTAPILELVQSQHEQLYSRLFIS